MQRLEPKKAAPTRRAPKNKAVPRAKAKASPPPMPLVLVDSTRLRQEIRKEYNEVVREVMFHGISHLGAYERIMQRRKKEKEGSAEDDQSREKEENPDFDFGDAEDFGKQGDFENPQTAKQNRHDTLPEMALARLK